MDAILMILEGLGSFFGLFGETSGIISSNWFFGQYLTDFFTWLIDFGARIFGG